MIGFLRGVIIKKQPPFLLLDVQGIGYEIEAPMTTFYVLPEINNEVEIFTHLVVRDDAHLLFGFATEVASDSSVGSFACFAGEDPICLNGNPDDFCLNDMLLFIFSFLYYIPREFIILTWFHNLSVS